MARRWIRPRGLHILIAGLTALALSVGILQYPAHGQSATGDPRPSSNVAVVPGFKAPVYSGNFGVPTFPASDPRLSAYHFTGLSKNKLTAAGLSPYDTVVLYGIRWSDISASQQAALNTFAATHKVLIWDADGTGSQNYGTFIHPFSETASGENGVPNNSVVQFPTGANFLASDKPSSPYYLDPAQLVTEKHEINHMNAMTTGTKNWLPALVAANKEIPKGGWPLAWSYGVIGNHTGMTIYSGIDADAFTAQLTPNNAINELKYQLRATFRTTPDTTCAPNCGLGSSGGGTTHASCGFAKPIPKRWVHGRLVVRLKTSVAAGIVGRIVNRKGKVLVSAPEGSSSVIPLKLRTKRLPTNRKSRLRAQVLVNGKLACTKRFSLKVDNTKPRLLRLTTWRTAGQDHLRLRVSERSSMSFTGRHVPRRRPVLIAPGRDINVQFSGAVRTARLIVRDRAGNTVVRRLVWH